MSHVTGKQYRMSELVSSSITSDFEAIFTINSNESMPPITRVIQLNERIVFELDTGSSVTIISTATVNALFCRKYCLPFNQPETAFLDDMLENVMFNARC